MGNDELTTNVSADIYDHRGRSTTERIAILGRGGEPVTAEQREQAHQLLNAMLRAARPFGVSLDDFDWVINLPGGCLDVILAKTRKDIPR